MKSSLRPMMILKAAVVMTVVSILPACAQSYGQSSNATSEWIDDSADYQYTRDRDSNEPYSQAELDQMLAPIALYPDSVLSHILIAATYPLEVVMADRWAQQNTRLKGDKAINAVDDKAWDASVKALVAFPTVLERMSNNLDWTESVGEAFLSDEEQVLETIQQLRQRAYDEGNLDTLDHLRVTHEEEDIIIEPARRDVVYIPVYNTRIVYGPWWWNHYPPVYWHHDDFYYRRSHAVYWGPSVYLSHGFFFSGFHWHNHHVVVVDRRYRHRYHRNYYSNRYIVRHEHARRWNHDYRHRRGVEYKNPRTRDFFERRDRSPRSVNTAKQPRITDRDTRMIRERQARDAHQVENGLQRNSRFNRDPRLVNSRSQNNDARNIKRQQRMNTEAARDGIRRDTRAIRNDRADRPRNVRDTRATSQTNSQREGRAIRKERMVNDNRNVKRPRENVRTEQQSRQSVRVERAQETQKNTVRQERAPKRIESQSTGKRSMDTRAIRQNNRRSEMGGRSISRERSSGSRSSGTRAPRERRLQ